MKHRVVERSSPAGTKLVIPTEEGLCELLIDEVHMGAGYLGACRIGTVLA